MTASSSTSWTWAIRGCSASPLSLECMFCPLFAQWELVQGHSCERVVCCGELWMVYVTEPSERFFINFQDSGPWMQGSAHLVGTQDKPCNKSVPSFITPATYQSGRVCLFLWSLPTLHVQGPVSDYTQEAPEEAADQQRQFIASSRTQRQTPREGNGFEIYLLKRKEGKKKRRERG